MTLCLPGAGEEVFNGGVGGFESGGVGGSWAGGAGGSWKRIRQTKNTSLHEVFREQGLVHPNRRMWKRLHVGIQRCGTFSEPKKEAIGSRGSCPQIKAERQEIG